MSTISAPTAIPAIVILSRADVSWRIINTCAIAVVIVSAAWLQMMLTERARADALRAELALRCERPERVDQITVAHPDGRCELITLTGPGGISLLRRF